ncbi:MAG: hypothetical protein HOE48_06785 [Candidatus Latescibacteria bacterium]|jgi:hypothetical protein|nr:hypothetical protein [Candidatus Latescibacterota bacterium]MBT5829516.1 hypothetical protein [Candidatus Latescibacterota bacterium]
MIAQDVTDTTAVGERGLNPFLVAPLTRDTFTPRPAPATHTDDKDLMFFLTRSYQTLIYCDGGD